ncbi:16S rRNA (cytosine(1402)-N(4))-methyltransferase RsmH [Taibaiella chishuiensis]|uniref:Ribosomal RNA small subunit methyltransferase H n=1 Tax=Taibaiella chishuiensis TaxID=1434707 RepID=A0A2P8DBZ1_9BACT|nr:16S rRNA (cytosine(1402)-N(4))-methyltransferase RsmH [Taibaiella chishuiensis]PSK94740.1 16S rRNA (cytosine1402-N4)-methyltransferase [Taibaiella chishuiensis]
MSNPSTYHRSVLLHEAVDALNIRDNGVYVDGTFGGGGHSREILKRLGKKGKLIVFDHDKDAWQNLPDDKRIILVKENFRYLKRFLRLHGSPRVDGILVDLGVSSFQFDTADRGFSIRFDAPLDMRMDERADFTATDLVRDYSEEQLHRILEQYGEVRNARTLAKTIVDGRKKMSVQTIQSFKDLIGDCIKGNPNRYLAQVFQALRIEVNDEMGVLQDFLQQTIACLNPGGRLAVITFHSLEDRMVKQFMKRGTFETEQQTDPFGRSLFENPLKALKDIVPTEEEINENPRSRSARLRVAEKI